MVDGDGSFFIALFPIYLFLFCFIQLYIGDLLLVRFYNFQLLQINPIHSNLHLLAFILEKFVCALDVKNRKKYQK